MKVVTASRQKVSQSSLDPAAAVATEFVCEFVCEFATEFVAGLVARLEIVIDMRSLLE
ncbi:hypothetical protein [Paraburkholderia tagetis]|uniref:Uncharacterized protein n=1 Tax=Paraburkholderia tagetis TaxID=2913261 RepID=A0A9X1RPR8_9BURK|nr:hypothetical protein [Paraburkholderia tagetis]MCG5073686.1 hypothetical protein [Paraburkholderia tagetis]